MVSLPAAQPDVDWGTYFARRLTTRLEQITRRLKRQGAPALRPHLGSVFALLEEAHRIPGAATAALDLIEALHPWPVRWGQADRWLGELKFAVQQLPEPQPASRRARALADLADLYLHTRQIDLAVATGRAAQAAAQAVSDAHAHAVGSSAIVGALKASGRHAEAELEQLHAEQELEQLALAAAPAASAAAGAILSLEKFDLLRRQGKTEAAIRAAGEHINRIKSLPGRDLQLLGTLHESRGVLFWSQGRYARAIEDLDLANACFKAGGNEISQASVDANRGLIYFSLGSYLQAEMALRRAIKLSQDCNYRSNLMRQIGNLGLVYWARGRLDEARLYVQQALDLAVQAGDVREQLLESGNLATLQLYQGEFAPARPAVEAAAAAFRQAANLEVLGGALVDLAICLHGLGDLPAAWEAAREARQIAGDIQLEGLQVIAMRCLAHVGAVPDPAALLQQAEAMAHRLGRRLDEVGCRLALCRYAAPEQAAQVWQQAGAQLQEMGAEPWLQGRTPADPPLLPLFV
ncbi:MAG TPA: tetratricopeptide repeat protein [Anaerolineaceae bacterium]|jgi:tetratricopeptide (TPR) repeat protein|nr:tetratricopeptide repeat protein [Anaerolineaceae bacterium]